MSVDDEHGQLPEVQGSQNTSSFPDVIAEGFTAITTGIPPQAQRSFWKAFGRVFTAGAEWPAKALEGKSRVSAARANVEVAKREAEAADIKARQKAREIIYRDSAKAAASQFKDSELALRALDFHAADIVREQAVREDVLLLAAKELERDPPVIESDSEIDDDWLTTFFREASTRTAEEYKLKFAKILAGEIRQPGSFSLSTIQVFSKLDKSTADTFYKACNISTLIAGNAIIISAGFAEAGSNGLSEFGLKYRDISLLMEVGLLQYGVNVGLTISKDMVDQGIRLDCGGQSIALAKYDDSPEVITGTPLRIEGPLFTLAGLHLRGIVSMEANEDYLKMFARWLRASNVALVKNVHNVGDVWYGTKIEI